MIASLYARSTEAAAPIVSFLPIAFNTVKQNIYIYIRVLVVFFQYEKLSLKFQIPRQNGCRIDVLYCTALLEVRNAIGAEWLLGNYYYYYYYECMINRYHYFPYTFMFFK
jgi:hypothetical protein